MKTVLLILTMVLVISTAQALIGNICFAADYTQDPSCQGAWLFKEGSGATVADSSQNSNTATFGSGGDAPAWASGSPPPVEGSSYIYFDNDELKIENHPSLKPASDQLTVVGWATFDVKKSYDPIIGTRWGYVLLSTTTGTKPSFLINTENGGTTLYSSSQWTDDDIGTWHHFAGVYDGSTIKIYVDGVEEGSEAASGSLHYHYSSERISIGEIIYSCSLSGNVAEVALFDRALSQAEINDIMNNGLKGETAPELEVSISATPTSGQVPLDIYFTGSVSGQVVSYAWNFGDGVTSAEQNPTHTYNNPGNYQATLTVTDIYGLQDSASVAITASGSSGEPPQSIGFQASLEDTQGLPLEGTFDLTFRLYDTDFAGDPLWEETQNVYVEEGLLDVELGAQTAIELPFDKQYWLGVEVEADGEMSPRFKFKSVPYSFKSMQ